MYVSLSNLPSSKKQYQKALGDFYGGLQTRYTPDAISANQFSELKNLLWENGTVRSRKGISAITSISDIHEGADTEVLAMYDTAWHDYIVFLSGDHFGCFDIKTGTAREILTAEETSLLVARSEGTFFRYGEHLYYKAYGGYYEFTIADNTRAISVRELGLSAGTIPIIQINTNRAGVGDLYQPENRLSSQKEVWFNADSGVQFAEIPCDGTSTSFELSQYVSASTTNGYSVSQSGSLPGIVVSAPTSAFFTSAIWKKYGAQQYRVRAFIEQGGVPNWRIEILNYKQQPGWTMVDVLNHAGMKSTFGITLTPDYPEATIYENDTINFSVLYDPQANTVASVGDILCGSVKLIKDVDYEIDDTLGVTMLSGAGTYLEQYGVPTAGMQWTVQYTMDATLYKLPVSGIDSIDSVYVNGELYTEQADHEVELADGKYFADLGQGTIKFKQNFGQYGNDQVNANYIKVVYTKANAEAFAAFNDCSIAAVFGGGGIEENTIVFAGAKAQPNAIFWTGNSTFGTDPYYVPIDNYNLVGEYNDPIAAFGRQQDRLVIFQNNRISSATYTNELVDGRANIQLNIKLLNDQFGCDCPRSVQLIDNNLVWADTRRGILYLKDSTYAYESLIVCISDNINDPSIGGLNKGLLETLRAHRAFVHSLDDGEHYWLFALKKAYVWDYNLQGFTANTDRLSWWELEYSNPVKSAAKDGAKRYFCATKNVQADSDEWPTAYIAEENNLLADNVAGTITPIDKVARIQTQSFGTYDSYKNVLRSVFSMRSDVNAHAKITYISDWEERDDLTDIGHAAVEDSTLPALFMRKPKCLHVQSFTIRLTDNTIGMDLPLQTIQLTYNYQGRYK